MRVQDLSFARLVSPGSRSDLIVQGSSYFKALRSIDANDNQRRTHREMFDDVEVSAGLKHWWKHQVGNAISPTWFAVRSMPS